jgi:ferric iron reductase protein FhuF
MEITMDLSPAETYFNISAAGSPSPELSVPVAELLRSGPMKHILDHSGMILKAISGDLPASFVGLTYFGIFAAELMVMSQYNRMLDMTPDNLTFQLERNGSYPSGIFRIGELKWSDLPSGGEERSQAVRDGFTGLFQETINPLVENTARQAGVHPSLIWNQYGARMVWAKDFIGKQEWSEQASSRFLEDCELLTSLPATVFNRSKNPFAHKPRYVDNPYNSEEPALIRSSCCMYYRKENGVKCYTCPMLKAEEREAMYSAIKAERG